VLLIVGVVLGHTTLAWTGIGTWVLEEPQVREPLFSFLSLVGAVVALMAMPLFFLIAGAFTPASLQRKGPGRFLGDRLLRLGLPMVFYVLAVSPFVEYVDSDNVGWDRGFGSFAPHMWWPPAPGPTWFLGVLLVYSVLYAAYRALRPGRPPAAPPRAGQLTAAAAAIAAASYAVRLAVPLGDELWRLALGQAPAWTVGFILGTAGAERGWFTGLDPALGRRLRRAAGASAGAVVALFAAAALAGVDFDELVPCHETFARFEVAPAFRDTARPAGRRPWSDGTKWSCPSQTDATPSSRRTL
jgi:hypothetical protein